MEQLPPLILVNHFYQNIELLFTVFSAGSGFQQAGSGANYLCLPRDPTISPRKAGPYYGYVMGAKYNHPLSPATNHGIVPCALCETKRSTVFMLPANDECHEGWTTEYSGWLASSYHYNKNRHRVCLRRWSSSKCMLI